MAADLVKEDYTESIAQGFIQSELTQVYQVLMNNRTDKPSQVLQQSGIPVLGQPSVLAATGALVWCTSRTPTRDQTGATERQWLVTCKFTNYTQQFERDQNGNPVENPADAVKRVEVQYVEYQEPVTDALLYNVTQNGPAGTPGAVFFPKPTWFPSASLAADERGPVMVSNGRPVEVFRSAYRKVVSVSQVFRNWNNSWDNYAGKVNNDEITITESDSEGQRWSETFPAYTLRMLPPARENIWKDAKLYYRRTMTMEHNALTWRHSEMDRDTARRVFVGQKRADGETYTQEQLDELQIEGEWGYQEITTMTAEGERVAIGNHVAFNGWGMEQPVMRGDSMMYTPDRAFFTNWDIHREIAFAPLNL